MAYTEELFLLYNSQICRLCGEENSNGYPLFRSDTDETDLSVLINTYLPLKITDDGKYPRWICPGCHLQVHSTVQFFNLVVTGQESLRQIYASQCEEQKKAAAELVANCPNNTSIAENEAILDEGGDLSGKLFTFDENISQKMGVNPETPKRKRGRPLKTSQFLETIQKPAGELPIPKETQILDEPIDEGSNGRRKRRIKVPSRFQEAVQGKELEKVYMESGVIERSDFGSDIDDGIEILRDDFDTFYPEEVIGHLQDNEGVNLGDLVVINNKEKIYKKKNKKTRFMCDICKICFCYKQKFLQHRFSHQNVRFECTQCLQNFVERPALVQHQTETDHKGEGIIEGFSTLPFNSNLTKTSNDEALQLDLNTTVNSTEQTNLDNNFIKDDSCRDLVGDRIDNIDDYDNQFGDVFKKIDEAEAEKVLHQLQDMKPAESNFMHLSDFSAQHGDKTVENDKIIENVENLSDELNDSQIDADDVGDDDPTKKKSYYCNLCDRYFKRITSYLYHKESEHNDGRRFVCSKCKKSFKNKTLLQRHQLVHSALRPYACTLCNATFKAKTNLLYHKISHTGEKKYQCNICEKFFVHKNSLTLHLRCHTGQKPFKCSVCSKGFSQFGNMQEHLRIHTGECPFECHICGRKFKTSSQCRMHVKRHDVEKPLKCTLCEKSFLQLQEFKNHQRRHDNIKPYSCDVCSKSFIELGALRKHLRLHTGEKPFVCTECPRRFSDRSNLKKHLKIHENKKRANELMNSTRSKTTAQTLDELTASVVDTQSLILSESGSNPVGDSTMWSLVDNDTCLDSSAVTSLPQNSIVPNQLVYVTYQDPDNPIGNKTTLFVVNDTNTGSMVDDLKMSSIVSKHLGPATSLDENCSDDQLLQHSNVFLTNNDNNSNDIQTVLLNIQDQVGIQLDQTELFQSDVSNSEVQLVTEQKMRLLNYSDSLDIPD